MLDRRETEQRKLSDAEHLNSGVNVIDVRDAAKYGLDFFLCQDGSPNLPLFLKWKLEKLQKETDVAEFKTIERMRKEAKILNTLPAKALFIHTDTTRHIGMASYLILAEWRFFSSADA